MLQSAIARFGAIAGVLFLFGWLAQAWLGAAPEPAFIQQAMTPQKRAEAMGIKFEKLKPSYLNWCNRSGKMLFTCGFSSRTKGTLGKT